ncbi:MAG: hypothetical protein K1X57_10785 [Gemmataceae bacterium]|nr:hypothetical protein [Gemmataceae bacterium]
MTRSGSARTSGTRYEGGVLTGILAILGLFSAISLVWQILDPRPVSLAGLTVDRLNAALTLLVAAIGAVTLRFSFRYLDGNPRQARFLRFLTATVVSAYVLMCSTHLVLLFAAWSLTSLGLHGLLTIYDDRPESLRPARKKFLISRIGDVALLAAIFLIYRDTGSFDLGSYVSAVSEIGRATSLEVVAVLISLAALTKSAQFPFHSWLPETMESPTPVSALMHAGIINAGGALLIKFAPVIVRVPEVMLLLSIVGTLTFSLGMLAMWAQVKVKRTLAWSTVSQMGFMMVQCGLGAFPAAALHMVGHGCYKAWSFLRSGELPIGSIPSVTPARALVLATVGILVAIPALALASMVTGYAPLHSPGEFGLSAILALSIGQLWVALLGQPSPRSGRDIARVPGAIAASLVATVGACALYQGAAAFLSPVLGELPVNRDTAAWCAAIIPVIALAVLSILHALLPLLDLVSSGRALRVHALHGFYLGAVADRFVGSVWSSPRIPSPGVSRA